MTSFIALANSAGIACASDTDHTIFPLSKTEPLAIAVNPSSPIPWDDIVDSVKSNGSFASKEDFTEYIKAFESMIADYKFKIDLKKLSDEEAAVVFMGYGNSDIFPTVCKARLVFENDCCNIAILSTEQITHDNEASITTIGNFENLATILYGSTKETDAFLIKKQEEAYNKFKKRVFEKFRDTDAEESMTKRFNEFDVNDAGIQYISETRRQYMEDNIKIGLDSFSVEELVYSVEKLVNANARLSHLLTNSQGLPGSTREIAVVTRAEGLTWCLHSLFAL